MNNIKLGSILRYHNSRWNTIVIIDRVLPHGMVSAIYKTPYGDRKRYDTCVDDMGDGRFTLICE